MRRAIFSCCLVALIAAVAISGCGGDAGGNDEAAQEVSSAYGEVVLGLRDAALSNATYGAVRRAQDLPAAERAAVAGFCEMAWQIDVNEEEETLAFRRYTVNRLKAKAGIKFERASKALDAPLLQLRRIVGLNQLDAELIRRYKKACYR